MTEIKNKVAYYQYNPEYLLKEQSYTELKISGNKIVFFDESLAKSFKFYEDKNKNWTLVFFIDSPYKKIIQVKFSDEKPKVRNLGEGFLCHEKELSDEIVQYSNEMLETKSLTKEDFVKTSSNGHIATVRKGFIYASETPGQFERAVLISGLAHAYKLVMNQLSESARSVSEENNTRILNVCESAAKFNIQYYSRYPIKLENAELRAFWEAFEGQWQISRLNDELLRQLEAMQSLLHFKESVLIAERHQNQNIKLTIMITLAGIVFSLLSTFIGHKLGWNN
ncbi:MULTISPECIES: hypothetical protein [unclassified Methylophilus]|uniref:hypothetical protein n=1 Tax=unclassified Methylophilus TaxID=2630143 RepID=UPI00070001A2|nr:MULTISPECIES: hypothetical protein [unclassified Methylophilus]KQT41362.1 hypothetical protein ASG34_11515 [Methylophilus sp. Leaf416]KQT57883.1 hypothetical protein ASG44_13115 [Methylophilus sp. Leaf459]